MYTTAPHYCSSLLLVLPCLLASLIRLMADAAPTPRPTIFQSSSLLPSFHCCSS